MNLLARGEFQLNRTTGKWDILKGTLKPFLVGGYFVLDY